MFDDAQRPGRALMDTLGLHALGCPDAQISCTNLDRGLVAGYLFALTEYVFGGGVIEDGYTVQGFEPHHRWPVMYQEAMVVPDRLVLNVDPR